MRAIQVHSTKYDGSLHYRYRMRLVHEEEKLLMLYAAPGEHVESYRGQMLTTRHSLGLYWTDSFYNLTVNWTADWRPISHYINVATPASWNDGTLRFIDLDLDIIWRYNPEELILDDQDEFEAHKIQFGYPSELIAQSWQSSNEVSRLIHERRYPFDGSLYTWRPNGAP